VHCYLKIVEKSLFAAVEWKISAKKVVICSEIEKGWIENARILKEFV
jgi:hypothetical protein